MHGSLSIGKNHVRWSKAHTEGYVSVIAIGVLSGIVTAYARTPLHLPGHKALLWMTPVLAARMVTRARAGASVGTLFATLTTLTLGGRLAGGVAELSLVILAGIVLDLVAYMVERRNFPFWRRLGLLALAGLAGNLICFVKRLFDPTGALDVDTVTAAGSYALFGFLAGAFGGATGAAIRNRFHKSAKSGDR